MAGRGKTGGIEKDSPRGGRPPKARTRLARAIITKTTQEKPTDAKHRHQEWIKFLRQIDEETPPDLDLHVFVDNYATHKHPRVKAWLKRHPRLRIGLVLNTPCWILPVR